MGALKQAGASKRKYSWDLTFIHLCMMLYVISSLRTHLGYVLFLQRHVPHPGSLVCFLYENDTITEQPIQLHNLTFKLLMDAKAFIYDSAAAQQNFFLYYSFPQTHTPMFNDERFKGKSKRGKYSHISGSALISGFFGITVGNVWLWVFCWVWSLDEWVWSMSWPTSLP